MEPLKFVRSGNNSFFKSIVYEGFNYEVSFLIYHDQDIPTDVSFKKLWHPSQPDITWRFGDDTAIISMNCDFSSNNYEEIQKYIGDAHDLIEYLKVHYKELIKEGR